MNMLRFLGLIIFTYILLCINLRHYQLASAESIPPLPSLPSPSINITPITSAIPNFAPPPNTPATIPTTTTSPSVSTPQTAAPLPTQPVLPTQPNTIISAPVSADNTKKTNIKFTEYKSICNREEEPKIIFSESVKNKRIALIQSKIDQSIFEKKPETTQILKAALIKEYLKQENYKKAEDLFKQESVQLKESDQIVISADIDINKKLIRTAKVNLNKYLESHTKDIQALEKLADVNNLLNNFTEAKIVYDDLEKINTHKKYTELICQNSSFNSDHDAVRIYCGRLKKEDPYNYNADIYIGISLREQELYSEAIKSFENSLKIKKSEFATTCLAESYSLNKNQAKAIENYELAIKIQPDSKRARLGLANAYIKKNMYQEALEQFNQACKLGLKPLVEMSSVANLLKIQKSNLANIYFDEMQNCKSNNTAK